MEEQSDKSFESIKHLDADGVEFWLARELQIALQYEKWQNFEKVIYTAQVACKISQHEVVEHFTEVSKMIEMAIGAKAKLGITDIGNSEKRKFRKIKDYQLSRYACYLIVMNGDPRKQIIANGQTYFAVKTRQQEFQELFERLSEDDKRLFLRGDVKQKNMILAQAARDSGVITGLEFALFQDAGYKGLYGGETRAQIANRKGINDNEEILDFMGSEELAANLFRITQANAAIKRTKPTTAQQATDTHHKVGSTVRKAIQEIGGTMPENLPLPDKSIKQIEDEQKKLLKRKN